MKKVLIVSKLREKYLFTMNNAFSSLTALNGMNIPMYGAIKRCTPFVNLFLSVTILNKPWPSNLLVLSVGKLYVEIAFYYI